jgi:hypothetical protein
MVPFNANTSIPVLWLALASRYHLDQNSKSMVPPYWRDDRPVLRISLSRRSDRLRLPERIVFYKPVSDSSAAGALAAMLLHNKQDAVYRVLAFTNVNNMELPLAFELTALREAGPGEESRKQYPRLKVEARIDSIRSTCTRTQFVPLLLTDQVATILDHRLDLPRTTPGGDALFYHGNKWPTLVELTNLPDFARYMSMREKSLATAGGDVIGYSNGTEIHRWKGGHRLDGSIAAPPR